MEPKQVSELEAIQTLQRRATDNVCNVRERMKKKLDILFGAPISKPENGTITGEPRPCPAGMIESLRREAEDALSRSEQLQVLMSKFEEL